MTESDIKQRLEYLRGEIRFERISYEEIAELQSLHAKIMPGDVELLQWAGVPENGPRCPKCGETDAFEFTYIEDITNRRSVIGFRDDGVLEVNSHYATDGRDDGDNPRLRCGSCGQEFPIPEDLDVDFV